MVTNDAGLCLIRTTNGVIADFVDRNSLGINPTLRLIVGGDPGANDRNPPMWKHVRRI